MVMLTYNKMVYGCTRLLNLITVAQYLCPVRRKKRIKLGGRRENSHDVCLDLEPNTHHSLTMGLIDASHRG